MNPLVTLEEALAQVRSDADADAFWFHTWIPAVEAAVRSWLKDEWRLYVQSGIEDSNGDPIAAEDSNGPIVQPMVKAAVLVELAQQYRYRDGTNATPVPQHWGHGYVLGAGATSLLAGLRKSTAA